MTREEKLKKIKEVISDKTLSFGCVIKVRFENKADWLFSAIVMTDYWIDSKHKEMVCIVWNGGQSKSYIAREKIESVVWHPIMIWDVLDWMTKWPNFFDDTIPVIDLWTELRKPIDKQIDQCIDYVYSLIPTQ